MICPRCGHDNLPGADDCENCLLALSPLDQPVGQDHVERSLLEDRVGALPSRAPVTVSDDADLGVALRVMLAAKVGAVLVVDVAGRLVGILTERDLLMKVIGLHDPYERLPVRDFMTRDPVAVSLADTLAFALHKMDVGGYRHLPVVREGRPEGVISARDIIRHITRLSRDWV